ncbi:MAG: rhamnose utilization protein RhaD (predicted bifunctional aldolase and dehydrogenase), partial [Kiritimatiellia bacterium]
MQSRWSDDEAHAMVALYAERGVGEDVALRVYTSRCIGADSSLVLHGGGNTSVKTTAIDDTGRLVRVLCVKGSGWDLGRIEPAGLPAVRLDSLQALRSRTSLSDEEMVNAQRTRLLDSRSPNPSVETLLHAFLPHKFIDHSHADAILSIVDQPDAEAICREIYGHRLAVVPYVMPGFALSKLAAEVYEADPSVEGMLLLKHGLFTFGDTARQAYDRHIDAVSAAEAYVAESRHRPAEGPPGHTVPGLLPLLRGVLGNEGRRYLLRWRTNPSIEAFVCDPELGNVSQRGTATPDHVIRTKALPLLLDDPTDMSFDELEAHIIGRVAAYRVEYRAYVERQVRRTDRTIKPLDADPRV